MTDSPRSILEELVERYPCLEAVAPSIEATFSAIVTSTRQGGTVMVCGNGGSAADADHIVGELVKGFRLARPLDQARQDELRSRLPEDMQSVPEMLQSGVRAISLVSHAALTSAVANDVSADLVYAQQVAALGRPGDVAIGISTSGNARNVATALAVARALGLVTIALSGGTGGRLAQVAQIRIVVPEQETFKVQELHLPVYHALCAMVEQELFG